MNPFRDKATRARAKADRLTGPTAHDKAMADAFPLGPGFGRPGAARRIDASVNRAVGWVNADRDARYLEAQADAYDRGEVDAQGRMVTAASLTRSEKREAARQARLAKIAAAQGRIDGADPATVSPEDWATAHGHLAGPARALVMADHAARYGLSVPV